MLLLPHEVRLRVRRGQEPVCGALDEHESRLTPVLAPLLVLFVALALTLAAGAGGGLGAPLTAQEVEGAKLAALKARNIGPAGMSGRITAIDALVSDPDVVFVGAATGGLWKSTNGGHTWESLFDVQPILGIGSVAVFQPNPDIVWVGTGEGNPRNSAGVGAGVYKSLDGGRTWTFMGLRDSERIHRIVLHPTDPNIAYAGVMGPAWSDGERRGVFRTLDGGESWERILFVNERTGVSDLVMDPSNPNKLLAGMWEFRRSPWFFESGGPGSGLYITHDGGRQWVRLTPEDGLPRGELGRIGLAFAPSAPETTYALVEADASVLLRSRDGGRSWDTVNDQEGVAPRPFYYTDVVVDPTNELRLFNLHSRIEMSQDGGETFERIGPGVHSDIHALWIDPSDGKRMYLGSDGGVYESRDQGAHWRFVDNLPVGQFYHVDVDMAVPFNIYGGMQDNGSWRGPSDLWSVGGIPNHAWEEVGFGDGFKTVPDPTDPNLVYSMSQGGGLVRADRRTGARKGIRPWAPEGVTLRFNWNAPLALDPLSPGTLYYGSQFVHKTTDRGVSWQIISGDLTTNDPEKQRQEESGGLTPDNTGAENHTTLLTIAPSPVEAEVIWTGSDDGLVHVTRSGGGDWQEVGDRIGDLRDGTWIPHIEASKHQGGVAYVVADDHRRGDWTPYLFRTDDYGRDWDDIADEDQIYGFVHTLEEDPGSPNLLFAGTEFGLYVSLDRGDHWFRWVHGIPAAPVRSLVVHPRDHDLVVGTHGRGIYVLDDIRPLRALAENPSLLSLPVHLFQTPPAYLHTVAAADGYHFPGDAFFFGDSRPYGALLTYSVGEGREVGRESESPEVTVQILGPNGEVLRTLQGPARPGLNRLVWDLREESPVGEGEGDRYLDQGPEVLPGTYGLRVEVMGSEASGTVEVLPDPREEIPRAERILKREAVEAALEIFRVLHELESRLDTLTVAVAHGTRELADRRGETADSLRARADSLDRRLTSLGEDLADLNGLRRDLLGMTRTRDAPTEADRINLTRASDAVDRLTTRFNALLVQEVQPFRTGLVAAGLSAFSEVRPVVRRRPPADPESGGV